MTLVSGNIRSIVSYRIDVEVEDAQAVKPLSFYLCETLQYNKILINSDTYVCFNFWGIRRGFLERMRQTTVGLSKLSTTATFTTFA